MAAQKGGGCTPPEGLRSEPYEEDAAETVIAKAGTGEVKCGP
jgi:hypothetical protein